MICPDCEGKGQVEKPISLSSMGLVDCETCEGTGLLEDDPGEEITQRLDRIIELLEQIVGGNKQ